MIRVLPEALVNRIAAGEVIARPSSVVKELVENSIDAGATVIDLELANGCRDVVVRDNGRGFRREDAPLALVRHATSKIEAFDDLYRLSTRGFRGEALASIASVSRLAILSRCHDEDAGIRISAEGNSEGRIESAGAPKGTEVRVHELFFNTPARLHFLKSPSSELQQALQVVVRQALIRPEIGFTVKSERGELMNLPSGQPWDERVIALLGSGVRDHLLEVDEIRHDVRVRGYVMRPAAARKDRRQQFFFINGRPVSSRAMSAVVQDAYKGIIMVQRFPVCILDIILPEGEVDINVHPTKEEARFRNESLVNGVLHRVVHARLQRANLMPVMSFDDQAPSALSGHPSSGVSNPSGTGHFPGPSSPVMPGDFSLFTGSTMPSVSLPDQKRLEQQAVDVARSNAEFIEATRNEPVFTPRPSGDVFPPDSPGNHPGARSEDSPPCSVRPLTNSLRHLEDKPEDPIQYALLRDGVYPEPIGQISRCFIVAQIGGDMLLIDQHAAHERLLYLRFSDRALARPSQPLLIPVAVDVPVPAMAYIHHLVPLFEQLGLKMEPFGGQTFLVTTVPADLPRLDPAAVVADLLDDFEALGKIEEIDVLRDRIITRMACRAAIKSGAVLHLDEMRALIRDIANARLGFTCPHGRPTMILYTRDEMDRQFKRKV